MSSICGLYYLDGRPAAAPELERMIGVLSHWQPDRVGRWQQGEVALGHLALWSTPEAVNEICPYREPESGVVVTADARIDNRAELIATLGQANRPAGEIGDAELIVRAYLKWGEACVTHLIGDFAFGLWDPRNRRLFCARDPMGLRTFFYFADGRHFFFGSEIKALLAMPEVPRDEDPARFAQFVTGICVGDRTRFRSLRQLPPAHSLTVEAGQVTTRRYWWLDPEREIRFRRSEDYVEAFEEIFQRAVDARLRTPGRGIGCMLSGGLDATTMLGFALRSREIRPEQVSAYTWALRKGDDWRIRDERDYVEAFLRENPIDHHYLVLQSDRIFDRNPAIEHLQDGPNQDFQHRPMCDTFEDARARNIKAILLGDGGDETASYGAPDYLKELLMRCDFAGLRREARAWAVSARASEWQVWKSHIIKPLLRWSVLRSPFQAQTSYWDFHACLRSTESSGAPLTEEAIRQSGLLELYERCRPGLGWAWRHPVRCNQIDRITGSDGLAHVTTSCNYSAQYGIECRFPYLDRRVIEFCVAVPPEQHRYNDWGRLILRRCADRRIPAKIARRRDKSSTWPDIMRGLGHNEEMLRACFDRWAGNSRVAAFLDVRKLRMQLQEIVTIAQGGTPGRRPPMGMFCRAVSLGQYLEHS